MSGTPLPSVAWRAEKEAEPEVRMKGAVLSISPVTRRHRGNYTCHASNGWSNNKTVSKTILIDVQCRVLYRHTMHVTILL